MPKSIEQFIKIEKLSENQKGLSVSNFGWKSKILIIKRAQVSDPDIIDNFFEMVKNEFDKIELNEQIEAKDVYNCDEIEFNSVLRSRKFIGRRKREQKFDQLQDNNSMVMYMVLSTCNAAGEYLTSYVIEKAINLYKDGKTITIIRLFRWEYSYLFISKKQISKILYK